MGKASAGSSAARAFLEDRKPAPSRLGVGAKSVIGTRSASFRHEIGARPGTHIEEFLATNIGPVLLPDVSMHHRSSQSDHPTQQCARRVMTRPGAAAIIFISRGPRVVARGSAAPSFDRSAQFP